MFRGGSVAGNGGGHRRTTEVRGSGARHGDGGGSGGIFGSLTTSARRRAPRLSQILASKSALYLYWGVFVGAAGD